jgi:hypothetical protein
LFPVLALVLDALSVSFSRIKNTKLLGLLCLFLLHWCVTISVLLALAVQALMMIKNCLKDPHGVLKNWDQDSVDPCSWTMVTCSQENLVTGL